MTIVLSVEQKVDLEWLYLVYTWDVRDGSEPDLFGSASNELVATSAPELSVMGLASENPLEKGRYYITQAGADYLRKKEKIITPFDTSELTAARAEIARLTAELDASQKANADLAAKLKIADAGWDECIDVCDAKQREIDFLRTGEDSGIPF